MCVKKIEAGDSKALDDSELSALFADGISLQKESKQKFDAIKKGKAKKKKS